MPGLREPQGMAHVEQALSVWRMRIRGVRHRGHYLQKEQAVVARQVVYDPWRTRLLYPRPRKTLPH